MLPDTKKKSIRGRKHKPLSVKITRDGVLTIEIGVDVNAFATLRSTYAGQLTDPKRTGKEQDPRKVFKITNARGFATDVKRALLEEEEDGSSLLTNVLDAASEKAIEDGSEHFLEKGAQ